ncbi:MAG TPA: hypothetical protein VFJ28_09110 [Marmoricola sp.]|nr:hypothetical protein [Marmoricola sp.]
MTCTFVLGGAVLSPVAADRPAAWEEAPDPSLLSFLLVLVLIPLGLAGVLALLTVLPSMASDKGYEPGQSWRGESAWFGGPTKGVEAADNVTPEQIEAASAGRGGTSGKW